MTTFNVLEGLCDAVAGVVDPARFVAAEDRALAPNDRWSFVGVYRHVARSAAS